MRKLTFKEVFSSRKKPGIDVPVVNPVSSSANKNTLKLHTKSALNESQDIPHKKGTKPVLIKKNFAGLKK